MINNHSLDGLDMTPTTLELEWVVTIDTPTAGVDQVTAALGENVPLVQGPYDNCLYVREAGYQHFRALAGSHAGDEGSHQRTIRVHEAFGSRSKLLDDRHNPNRYWNRPDADQLHGTAIEIDA